MNNISKLLFGGILLDIIVFCGLQVLLTKSNIAYAEWIIPSQLNESYKNAQHYNSNSTSIPAATAQDYNPMTGAAIEKTPSSVAKNR
jgi:hypothetical protein